MKIGTHKIEQTAALAPMASVADRAYRELCKRYGASLVIGEMASAKGLFYSDRKTPELLQVTNQEYPMGVQLFGSEPDTMASACKKAAQYHPQFIDINMGCPVPKVVSTGSGSALMKTPKLAAEIVHACVDAVDLPISVKIRKGFEKDQSTAIELACLVEEAGASMITVHGRTRQQMYAPPVDIDVIRQVKQAVRIPVIGNGDITTPELAKQMYEQTECDLVMVGRGSYGRPWIFAEIAQYLKDGTQLPEKTISERLEIMLEHIALACQYKGERVGVRESRKVAAWYVKGLHGAAQFRAMCGKLEHYEDVKSLARQIQKVNCTV